MDNKVQVFKNDEFGQVRTLVINNEPHFVGKDVASILGYANPNEAIADHVDDEDKLNSKTLSSLGQRGGWLINESGLYSLILGSKLPSAKKFKRWITHDVLPSIRKTGSYSTTPTSESQLKRYKLYGKDVVRVKDAAAFFGVTVSALNYLMQCRKLVYNRHCLLLRGKLLSDFKQENPEVNKSISKATIISMEGILKLCRLYKKTLPPVTALAVREAAPIKQRPLVVDVPRNVKFLKWSSDIEEKLVALLGVVKSSAILSGR